ncbi:MAG: hypothetical protein JWL94_993 [Microbacteriaceae bacterium]|jgi:hypothetical protein|nr:hypothetical protein [Microbacteriaceae bacterium]HEV7956631.1 DUF6049 family protein [Marisediminicola sp.]
MRPITSLFALAVAIGVLGVPLTAVQPPAAAVDGMTRSATLPSATDPVGAATAALHVNAVPAASGVLAPDQDLSLAVTLSNRSAVALPAATLTVRFDRSPLDSAEELAGWLDPAEGAEPAVFGEVLQELPAPPLVAGESADLPIVIPAALLALDAAAGFAVHRLSAVVSVGDELTGEARTAITVNAASGFQPAPLAVAMPLTVPGASEGLISAERLESYTSVDGVLTRQLDQAFGRRVAIGIDPRIVASVRVLGDTAPRSAVSWLARLESAPNETFALTYADTDVSATSQAGLSVLAPTGFAIDPTRFSTETEPNSGDEELPGAGVSPGETSSPSPSPTGDPTPPPLPDDAALVDWDYTSTGIAWPRESTVVASDLDTFATAGLTTTILSSDNSSAGRLGATAGAATRIGGHSIATSDDLISDRLRAAVHASSEGDWQSAMVNLTASLATLAQDSALARGTVLATLDRESPLGGFRLSDTLSALEAIPWTAASGFRDALAQDPVEATLIDLPVMPERITRLQSLAAAEAATAQFATVLMDPILITGERRLSLLALSSQAWTVGETGWPAAVDEYIAASHDIESSVQVVDSSTLNVIADRAELPINVSNELNFPVTVFVTVQPRTPILHVLEKRVEVTVEANSQRRASVPVESVANGAVTIAISLSSATGVVIAPPTFTNLTVNAGWETAATAVLAVIVVGVFILGIIRTIRRRGRRADEKATDDAALESHE